MPSKKPFVRRFGQVDFDSMISLPGAAADDADIFVTRRGPFGSNRTLTRAQIIAGAGVVPDPLLLNDGSAADPTYSFSADPDTGVFRLGADQLAFAVNGIGQWVINPTELSAFVAGGPLLRNFDSTATVPNIISDSGDVNTGIGNAAPDQLSFIAGGVQIAQAKEVPDANQFIVAPGVIQNAPLTPSFAFGDGDTGFFESVDDTLAVVVAGTNTYQFAGDQFQGLAAASPQFRNVAATAIVANINPSKADPDTGLGSAALDQLSLIAGGVQIAQATEVVGANQFIVAPGAIQNAEATPSLAFGDGDTGFFESLDDALKVSTAGVARFVWFGDNFQGQVGGGPAMVNIAASATVPNHIARSTDTDTGIGSGAPDQLDLIAGGLSCIAVRETAAARQIGFYVTAPISLQTGVAVTDVAIHAALVNLGLITA